ncbi:MAG: DUF3122 domain-containing protein [Cyanobacteria bacterium SID2]|nr:DUF3122 domain-containing protein [Cyanobacteria bacterium SID2]MBP0002911.1 DUF3122 domain-containing protein [Cyanobacteria bacterium SBC]
MSTRMKGWRSIVLVLCCWGLWWGIPTTANASIQTYPDPTQGTVVVRSLKSLRDTTATSWQLVLFKRLDAGRIQSIHLRVVGFPGRSIEPSSPLVMLAATGQSWQAPNCSEMALEGGSLPDSTAEYDLFEIARQFHNDTAMRLSFALTDGGIVEIPVPPAIVREWRTLVFEAGTSIEVS